MIITFKNLFRPTYEGYAAGSWAASSVLMSGIGLLSAVPSTAFVTMAGMSVGMAAWRGWQAKKLWDYKLSMSGKAFSFIDGQEVLQFSRANQGTLWLGYGFEWEPRHTQAAFDAIKRDYSEIYPPKMYLKFHGVEHDPRELKGLAWIHGLEPKEGIITTPFSLMEGHCALWGTTGAGKTTMYGVLVPQMAIQPETTVIVIDPKGDKDLKRICQEAAIFSGNPDRFIMFHPAFPKDSIRIDPLKNFNRGTEQASRVASLTSSEAGKDTFAAVTWDAINAIGAGQRYLSERPQLSSSLNLLSNGVEKLLDRVIRKFLNEHCQGWQSMIQGLVTEATRGKLKTNMQNAKPELVAAAYYYKHELQGTLKVYGADILDNLLRIAEYPRDWHSKMVANVIPLLTMLNAEELGKMLSPDYDDIEDTRPIFDMQKIVEGNYIFYIGLDSLSDAEVGSAIASIVLSDLASLAGAIYNYGDGKVKKKIQLLIDEASEVCNQPLVQILNKGRGSGYSVTMAAQNYDDYVHRMGSEAQARMLLGNCNNTICMRVMDGRTQDFIVEKIGDTYIKQGSRSQGSGNKTEDHGMEFSGTISESISEQRVEKFPKDLLGKLPDLQYVAILAGGKFIKGRIPKVEIRH